MAEWIPVPFGVVNGVGRGMSELQGGPRVPEEGSSGFSFP